MNLADHTSTKGEPPFWLVGFFTDKGEFILVSDKIFYVEDEAESFAQKNAFEYPGIAFYVVAPTKGFKAIEKDPR